jgi:ribosomal protein L39E
MSKPQAGSKFRLSLALPVGAVMKWVSLRTALLEDDEGVEKGRRQWREGKLKECRWDEKISLRTT